MDEAKLAFTVHHKGHVYPAGSTAAKIGPHAAEIRAHAWEGGIAPPPDALADAEGAQHGGTLTGSPPAAMSALPTPAAPPEPGDQPDTQPDTQPDEAPAKKAAAGGRRPGGASSAS